MKFSVITVSYNSEDTIVETLESVNQQIHDDVEHIVIDGDSQDNTVKLIDQYGRRVSKLISEPDEGIYHAMNKGLDAASGDIIGFLNSDDRFEHPEVLSQYRQTFQEEEVEACYGDLVYTAKNDNSKVVRYWKSRPYEEGLCGRGWMPAHPTFYARSEIYEKYGYFDTSFTIQADFEMMFRLLDVYHITTAYIPEIMVRMTVGGQSNLNLKNIIKGNQEALAACHKHDYPAGFQFVVRKLARKIPQYIRKPSQ